MIIDLTSKSCGSSLFQSKKTPPNSSPFLKNTSGKQLLPLATEFLMQQNPEKSNQEKKINLLRRWKTLKYICDGKILVGTILMEFPSCFGIQKAPEGPRPDP